MTTYPVVCCGAPLALLVDDRPGGGELTIIGDPETSQTIVAAAPEIPGVPPAWPHGMPQQNIKKMWEGHSVTHTVGVGRSTWTLRCQTCSGQAVMTTDTLGRLMAKLGKAAPPDGAVMLADVCRILTFFRVLDT